MNSELIFIGEINTPYKTIEECPKNVSPAGPACRLCINDEYKDGLFGLEVGQKILILYWLDLSERTVSISKPRGGEGMFGTFALRAPFRPNPIGAATLEIVTICENIVTVNGLDCLDGTMLIDIKPDIN